MVSHYFYIDKTGPIRKLRRALVDAKLGGDARMVRAYNRNGREAGRVRQLTCDLQVEAEFLRRMRLERMKLPSDVDPLQLLPENPARGKERERLTREHLTTIKAQWSQCHRRQRTRIRDRILQNSYRQSRNGSVRKRGKQRTGHKGRGRRELAERGGRNE